MDTDKLDELERVAREATPGPWQVYQHAMTPFPELHDVVGATRDDDVAENLPSWIATYIATFDPPTILALITAARRPEPDREAVELAARIIDPVSFEKVRQGGKLDDAEWRCNRARDKATHILALFALSPAQAERDGWVMVPREPTEEMHEAALDQLGRNPDRPDEEIDAVYRAMLSAAPKVTT